MQRTEAMIYDTVFPKIEVRTQKAGGWTGHHQWKGQPLHCGRKDADGHRPIRRFGSRELRQFPSEMHIFFMKNKII